MPWPAFSFVGMLENWVYVTATTDNKHKFCWKSCAEQLSSTQLYRWSLLEKQAGRYEMS